MTGSAEETADLVQETYRKAWRALPGSAARPGSRPGSSASPGPPTPRLCAGPAWRRPRPERAADEPNREPSPEANAARNERASRLRHAVATLPQDLRYSVVAHYWAELPVREIADSEGITPMAVRKRLSRAFRLLAAALEEKTP